MLNLLSIWYTKRAELDFTLSEVPKRVQWIHVLIQVNMEVFEGTQKKEWPILGAGEGL